MSDKIKTAPDMPFRSPGIGMIIAFLCARCGIRKEATGRRLQLVKGLRSWVCKGCIK
jgi:hypothetical protein